MQKPEKHIKENERLKLLESYSILDTLPETDYDNLTTIAAEICQTPISLVTIVDNNRQWFKSHHGLEVLETPREYAFCAHTINDPSNFFSVEDARIDERFFDNPIVTGEPHVIFYAGVSLVGSDNLPLGTLCVIDNKPRTLTPNQVKSLKALSKQVMNLLDLRKAKNKLEKAVTDLEQVNQEMENFAYIAAHDLKSPLHNISSFASLFLKKYGSEVDAEGLDYINRISTSADKLNNLINGLLEFSKNKKVLQENKSEVDLSTILNEIKELLNVDNNCSITLKSAFDKIFTNRNALEQILINLVSNSIKYNDKPNTEIEVEVTEDESFYKISVKDNGPGIPKEYQHRAFNVFEVLSHQDRYGQRGNGIGLATVKKLVEAMGGNVSIESDIGEGAKFTFTLEKH